tara:strand:+ start:158 stop:352 length:195 start_codon:yes stop_codon:yes gene_type:complete
MKGGGGGQSKGKALAKLLDCKNKELVLKIIILSMTLGAVFALYCFVVCVWLLSLEQINCIGGWG